MNIGFPTPIFDFWYGWWKHLHFSYRFHKRYAVTVTSDKLGALRMRGKNLACTCMENNLGELRMRGKKI